MKLMYIAFIIYMEILAAEKNNESASLIKNISIFDNDLKIERTLYEKKKEAHYRKDALTRYIASLKIQKKISLKQTILQDIDNLKDNDYLKKLFVAYF